MHLDRRWGPIKKSVVQRKWFLIVFWSTGSSCRLASVIVTKQRLTVGSGITLPLHAELQAAIPVRRMEGKYSLEGKLQRKDAQSWRALADSVDSVRLTSGLQITQEDIRGEERRGKMNCGGSTAPKLTDIGCCSKVMPIVPKYPWTVSWQQQQQPGEVKPWNMRIRGSLN